MYSANPNLLAVLQPSRLLLLELLDGPQTIGDLVDGLFELLPDGPVCRNSLQAKVRRLERHGVVRREGRKAGEKTIVYELTEWGREQAHEQRRLLMEVSAAYNGGLPGDGMPERPFRRAVERSV